MSPHDFGPPGTGRPFPIAANNNGNEKSAFEKGLSSFPTTTTTSSASTTPYEETPPPETNTTTTTTHPPHHRRPGGKFADVLFTRKFSTFDRQNPSAANSPFHGFFTLFWLGVALFVVRIAADNWRRHGGPLGTNDIMRGMFSPGREVVVLLAADGAMCALTGVSWALQRLLLLLLLRGGGDGWLAWERCGWMLQHVSRPCVVAACQFWVAALLWLSCWCRASCGQFAFVLHADIDCCCEDRSGRRYSSAEWSG